MLGGLIIEQEPYMTQQPSGWLHYSKHTAEVDNTTRHGFLAHWRHWLLLAHTASGQVCMCVSCVHVLISLVCAASCSSAPFMMLFLWDKSQSPVRSINSGWIGSQLVVCGKEYALMHHTRACLFLFCIPWLFLCICLILLLLTPPSATCGLMLLKHDSGIYIFSCCGC